MSGTLRQIKTEDEFEQLLATSTKPVLVDLTAVWCGPCQALTPILEDLATSQDLVEVVTVDADDPRALSWRLGGSTLPRMYLFDRGVLQMEVAGVRDLAWLNDVVADYPALGIGEPDGLALPPRSPSRTVTVPAPSVGQASFMVINGHDNEFTMVAELPCTLEVSAGSHTVLSVSGDAISSGILAELAPDVIDELRIMGQLTPDALKEVTRLTSLRTVQSFGSNLEPADLEVLTALPSLRLLAVSGTDGTAVPLPEGLFPQVLGSYWLSPGFAAARAAAGLPVYEDRDEGSPLDIACKAVRRDDGDLDFTMTLTLKDGWYAYPPRSEEGVPVSITVTTHEVVSPLEAPSGRHLEGRTALTAVLAGDLDEVRLDATVQACDGTICLAPATTRLVVPLTVPKG